MSTIPSANATNRRFDTREIKTILVPTDFSEAANNAFIYAANLAWSLQAQLVVMNVYYTAPVVEGMIPPGFSESVKKEKIRLAEEKFLTYRQDLSRLLGDEISCEYRVEEGYAPDEILEVSRSQKVDLIVMGTLGQESMSQKILGSVTARVIEQAGCPVMAVPRSTQYEPIRHILFASTLEESDRVVVDELLNYADIFGASISCVHIHTPDESPEKKDLGMWNDLYASEVEQRKIHFEVVNNTDIVRGLHHYVVTHKADVVTLLTHRRKDKLDEWQTGLTRAYSLETDVPLLAFHEES